jgi:mRNA-degrading endonuclease RelE of RelBE toxin-antitoxin system
MARSAARRLAEQLPEAVATGCLEFIFGPLPNDPHRVGNPLREPFRGQWRARRGEYRLRYRIDDDQRAVYVLDVDHRRDAYRASVLDRSPDGVTAIPKGRRLPPMTTGPE